MKNIQLNLLSPEKKSKLEHLIKFLFTKNILEIVLFFCAVLAVAHLLGWLLLVDQLSGLSDSALLVNSGSAEHNQNIRRLNTAINELEAASAGFTPLTPRLAELAALLPGDIQLSSLTLDRRENKLLLAGKAQTRTALLNFRGLIEQVPWLQKVTVPFSQLLTKDNVDFQITGELKDFPSL